MQGDPHDPRRRSPHREERWPSPAYTHGSTHIPSSSPRSPPVSYPNPSYPTPYYPPTGHSGQYQYASVPVPDSRTHHHSSQPIPHSHASSLDRMVTSRNEIREPSPYSGASSASPISPNSADEPVLKKKRKRADAAQLKVLNDTYQRTAFPSTEERNELARMLDMSARSVQIWLVSSLAVLNFHTDHAISFILSGSKINGNRCDKPIDKPRAQPRTSHSPCLLNPIRWKTWDIRLSLHTGRAQSP